MTIVIQYIYFGLLLSSRDHVVVEGFFVEEALDLLLVGFAANLVGEEDSSQLY
jgi:hypothetical protein